MLHSEAMKTVGRRRSAHTLEAASKLQELAAGLVEGSRPATLVDLLSLCRALNERGARYVIIGGTAMLNLGFVRATEDIDLLVARGEEEERKVIEGVATLPDGAAREVIPGEIEQCEVIRGADEIVVDLMSRAFGITYESPRLRSCCG